MQSIKRRNSWKIDGAEKNVTCVLSRTFMDQIPTLQEKKKK